LQNLDLEVLRDYLRWHTMVGAMDYMSAPFQSLQQQAALNGINLGVPTPQHLRFNFKDTLPSQHPPSGDREDYGGGGGGGEEGVDKGGEEIAYANSLPPQTRNTFCFTQTLTSFADFLSHEWVVTSFPPENKAGAEALINLVYPQMGIRLQHVSWLDSVTRSQALTKWSEIVINVGYNPIWIEYTNLLISPGTSLVNFAAVNEFLTLQSLAQIGAAPNRNNMPNNNFMAQNAYYSQEGNSINMLAGLILPPAFNPQLPMMLNLASYGMVIGHELTHGFDNNGRMFNGSGALVNWWSNSSVTQFLERAACLVNQYDSFPVFGKYVNGLQTLPENIADLGGMNLAWAAYQANATLPTTQLLSTFTNDQYFFLHIAQTWCEKTTMPYAYMRLATDVHSPAHWRINGPMSNMPAFAQAFQCASTSFMGRSLTSSRCEVW